MKALVTGAGGFLGQYIAEQLVARSWQVRGLARGAYPALAQQGIEMIAADIRDAAAVADACRGVDVVHHVAAVTGIWGPWDHFYGVNVQGTENVLAGCRRHGVPKLVYTSSPSVTFAGDEQCGIDERSPYPSRWLCHYAHTKALAERQVLAASDANLHTCALRPHLIWGPRDTNLIPRLIERARRGQLARVGNSRNLVDMIYVENAAAAQLQAADALAPGAVACGRAYFVSQGEPVNCWQWIDEILALAGLPPVRRRVPLGVAWAAGATFEAVYRTLGIQTEPRMTRFLALQLGTSHFYNISRAQSDFGYRPAVSTAEGMRRMGDWLRQRNPTIDA